MNNLKVKINDVNEYKINNKQQSPIYEIIKILFIVV